MRFLACLAFLLATISGRLLDNTTGQPLAKVQVLLRGPHAAATRSDAEGRFTFRNLPAGTYTIVVQSRDVPRQTHAVQVRAGAAATIDLHVCSTTLDYQCGGGSPGAGNGAL
jgi:hypothetical protein